MSDEWNADPVRLDHSKFSLVFADDFTGDRLDSSRWIPHYLQHWTTEERSAARFVLGDDGLRLLIDVDQPAWRPRTARCAYRTSRPARSPEHSPDDSGEIFIAELFGSRSGQNHSTVRLGIKAHHDPRLRTDMVDLVLDLDTTTEHVYAAEWNNRTVRFYVDERHVHTVEQSLTYPLQLMVDLFEFPIDDKRERVDYPKSAQVRGVRGYDLAFRRD